MTKLQRHFKEHKEAYCSAALILLPFVAPLLLAELFSLAYDAFHLEPVLRFLATFVILLFLDVLIVFVSLFILACVYECFFPKKLDSSKENRFFDAFPIYGAIGVYFCLCIVFSDRIQEDWHRIVAQYTSDASSVSEVEERYWVTKSTRKTHNSSCRYYENSRGYYSSAGTGNNCRICGGAGTQQDRRISRSEAPDNKVQGGTVENPGAGMDKPVGQVAVMVTKPATAEPEKKESTFFLVDENTEGVYWYSFEEGMRHRDTCEKFGKGRDGYYTKKQNGRPCPMCCHDESDASSRQMPDKNAEGNLYWISASDRKVHNESCIWYGKYQGHYSTIPFGQNCPICGGAIVVINEPASISAPAGSAESASRAVEEASE